MSNLVSEIPLFTSAKAPRRQRSKSVTILMAVYNGAPWLPDQLCSILEQTHTDWSLLASDDGSTDDSKDLIACFARANPSTDISVTDGPRGGFAENFLNLVRKVDDDTPFVAFADQDDAWLPEKLERSLAALSSVPDDVPALYCGRTWVCSERLRPIRVSQKFKHKPSFHNAIVQSIGGGNTMVFNNAALRLLKKTLKGDFSVTSHDWWVYQIVSGAGGRVLYDEQPMVLYRQHGNNVIGAAEGFRGTLSRLGMVLRGQYKRWNAQNIDALYRARTTMTPDNASLLRTFKTARRMHFATRIGMLIRSRIYHQTRLGNAGFWLAAVLNRV